MINSEDIYFFLRICVAAFFGLFLVLDRSFINLFLNGRHDQSYFLPFFFFFVCLMVLYAYILYKEFNSQSAKICAVLFALALLPRLFFLFYIDYIPVSDFLRYFEYGNNVLIGEPSDYPGIPIFGVLAMQNAFLMLFFSSTLFGFQLSHILLGCVSCFMLYLILKQWDKRVAIISGFLFAVFPTAVLASVMTTNRNSALTFMLLSIYFFQKALTNLENPKLNHFLKYAFLSSIFFMISHFFHPSGIIVLISYGLFLVLYCFRQERFNKRLILLFCSHLLLFVMLPPLLINFTYNRGIITERYTYTMFKQLAIGTSYPTGNLSSVRGSYENIDSIINLRTAYIDGEPTLIRSLDRRTQREVYMVLVNHNLSELGVEGIVRLLRNKINTTWMVHDSYVNSLPWSGYLARLDRWYNEGLLTMELDRHRQNLRTRIIPGLANLNTAFTQWIYILSIIGIVLRRKIEKEAPPHIFMFILGGWMLLSAVLQQQPRYRFFGMPMFIIFAAMGIVCVYDFWKTSQNKNMKKS